MPADDAISQDYDLLLGQVATEFFERLAKGEAPQFEEFVERYPDIADMIRQALPALQVVNDSMAGGFNGSEQVFEGEKEKTLGDFRILRELGRGGMGVVYEAEQISMGDRRVALKVLPFAAMVDEKQLQRFRNEVRAAASLQHNSIVSVYSIGEERGVHFYAMQLVKGQSLASLIHELRQLSQCSPPHADSISLVISKTDDRLFVGAEPTTDMPKKDLVYQETVQTGTRAETLAERPASRNTGRSTSQHGTEYHRSVAELALQAARALEHAHERGVIHRDIKPANLMVDANANLFITDFGLAHMEENVGITMTGDLIGTLRYMSPEQAMSNRVVIDHRTDIYSLGITIYELLTTEYAFDGNDRATLLRQIAFQELRPLRQIDRTVPRDLATIIHTAAAKDPEERYSSAKDLADDLQAFLDHRNISAQPPTFSQVIAKWSWRHKSLVGIAAVFLTLASIGLAISNIIILSERAAKQSAMNELNEALATAEANLKQADRQRSRAEKNMQLAFKVLGEVQTSVLGGDLILDAHGIYLDAHGIYPQYRIQEVTERLELNDADQVILASEIAFFEQIASQNSESEFAKFESAKAAIRLAVIKASLGEVESAGPRLQKAILDLEVLLHNDADNFEYCMELGLAIYYSTRMCSWIPDKRDNFDRVIELASKVLTFDPENLGALRLRGMANIGCFKIEPAIKDFESILAVDPDRAIANFELAYLYRTQNVGTNKYLPFAEKAVLLSIPDSTESVIYLQFLARSLGPYLGPPILEEAAQKFSNPKWRSALLADAYSNRGDHKATIAQVEAHLEAGGKSTHLLLSSAKAHRMLGNRSQATRMFDLAQDAASSDLDHVEIAKEYLDELGLDERGNDEATLKHLALAEALNPNNPWIYYYRADLLDRSGQYEDAIQQFDKSLELDPLCTHFWVWRGRCSRSRGMLTRALTDFDKAVAVSKGRRRDLMFALINRADLHFRLSNFGQSLDDYRAFFELRPKHIGWFGSFSQLARCSDADICKQFKELLRDIESSLCESIQEDPSDVTGYLALSRLYEETERRHLAIEPYESALRLYPTDRDICMKLAELYIEFSEDGNRLDKAIECHLRIRQNNQDSQSHYDLALLYLCNGNDAAYKSVCETLLEKHKQSPNVGDIRLICFAASLSDAIDPSRYLSLAEEQLSDSDRHQFVYGASLYRASRSTEAIDVLSKCAIQPVDGSPVYGVFFLAMAYQDIGETERAEYWLKNALEQAETELSDPACKWYRRLTLELLRKQTLAKLELSIVDD